MLGLRLLKNEILNTKKQISKDTGKRNRQNEGKPTLGKKRKVLSLFLWQVPI